MTQTFITGKSIRLIVKLNAGDTTLTADTNLGITKGRLYLKNDNQVEWISFTGVSANGSYYNYTGLTRGLSQTADPATAGTGKTWLANQECILVAMHDQLFDKLQEQTLPNAINFSGSTNYGFAPASHTTTEMNSLTAPAGTIIYNSTEGENYQYIAGSWQVISAGSTQPNASETVAGKVELATNAEIGTGTSTGGTGARLCPPNDQFKSASAGVGDANKPIIRDANGLLDNTNINIASQAEAEAGSDNAKPMTSQRTKQAIDFNDSRFGNGTDGAISGALTITGSNNTVIVKNYTNFAPGANTVTITPTGCVTILKIRGTCDLTGTTFDFAGKGGQGGAGGTVAPISADGVVGGGVSSLLIQSYTGGGGGDTSTNTDGMGGGGGCSIATSGANGTGGVGGVVGSGATHPTYYDIAYSDNRGAVLIGPGTGGGGGSTGYDSPNLKGNGGTGGNGGGCLVIYAKSITFSSTTINANGSNGTNGTFQSPCTGGGGGGGGGGAVAIFYQSKTSTPTINVAGGTGGTGGGTGGNGGTGVSALIQI